MGRLRWQLTAQLNHHHHQVEIKTTAKTTSPHVLQKAADFVHAFLLGGCG